jgi:hypothetical protein
MEIDIKGFKVLIDDEDYEKVMQYKWQPHGRHFPNGNIYFSAHPHGKGVKHRTIQLHRVVMDCREGDGVTIDHINCNTLDNQKSNLRRANEAENSHNMGAYNTNTTGYKGVHQYKNGRVRGEICIHNKRIYIGCSKDPIECARWYDMMAIKLHKEFANTNFPKENYTQEEIDKLYNKVMGNRRPKNSTGYTGVWYDKRRKRYTAYIRNGKSMQSLGRYKTAEDAARAYDKKSMELHGNIEWLNFPEEWK